MAAEAGQPLNGGTPAIRPDYVAQSTITARLMRAAIHDTARLVLLPRVARQTVTVPTLDVERFELKSWDELLADGSVGRIRLTSGEVAAALARAGAADPALDEPLGKPADLYTEVFFGLLDPAAIGGNVLGGVRNFDDFRRRLPVGGHAFFMASNGPYDFHGSNHWRKEHGFRFDRVRIVQDGQTLGFVHDDYQKFLTSARNAPGTLRGFHAQEEAGVFILSPNVSFDPVKPWRLELLVTTTGQNPVTAIFPFDYKLPAALILMPDEPVVAPWVEAWRDARVNVAILAVLLVVLTAIFAFQAQLSRTRRAHKLIRNGFLL